jgi:hypothetical protein
MSSVLWAILQPILGAALRELLNAIFGYVKDRQALESAKDLGRAEANAATAQAAAAAADRMASVGLPSDEEIISDLTSGAA